MFQSIKLYSKSFHLTTMVCFIVIPDPIFISHPSQYLVFQSEAHCKTIPYTPAHFISVILVIFQCEYSVLAIGHHRASLPSTGWRLRHSTEGWYPVSNMVPRLCSLVVFGNWFIRQPLKTRLGSLDLWTLIMAAPQPRSFNTICWWRPVSTYTARSDVPSKAAEGNIFQDRCGCPVRAREHTTTYAP